MSKERKTIPKLRFPEFLKEGGWKIKSINDVCDILNNVRKPISSTERNKGPYPYYGASGIIDFIDDYIFDEKLLLVGEDGAKWGAYENTAFLVKGKYWVNNHAHVLKPKLVNDKLLESYLVKLDLHPYITGAAPPKLTLGKLKEIPVPVPDNPHEQQKIASCLSSIDEVIADHIQKLELLKNHKKGLMQNLFPEEGEKAPKFRFKEFKKDGDWEKKKLVEIGKITSGGTPNRSNSEFWNGDIPWISTTLVDFNTINEANEYITEIGLQNSSAKIFPKNTILMAMYGQGKTRGKVAILGIEAATNQACAAIILKDKYNTDFVFQYLAANYDEIRKMSNSGGQENLSGGLIEIIPIPLPKNPKEQQKIASCLSSLDTLIREHTEKIEQLKLHKKGLMQGLFPKIIG